MGDLRRRPVIFSLTRFDRLKLLPVLLTLAPLEPKPKVFGASHSSETPVPLVVPVRSEVSIPTGEGAGFLMTLSLRADRAFTDEAAWSRCDVP